MPDVLFVCVHNAGRSRMAEVLFNAAAAGRWTAGSAGTEPARHPHAEVVQAMAELGLTVEQRPGRLLTQELAASARHIVGMGCGVQEACPALRLDVEDWDLADPKGRTIDEVRAIRDDIAARVTRLIAHLDAVHG